MRAALRNLGTAHAAHTTWLPGGRARQGRSKPSAYMLAAQEAVKCEGSCGEASIKAAISCEPAELLPAVSAAQAECVGWLRLSTGRHKHKAPGRRTQSKWGLGPVQLAVDVSTGRKLRMPAGSSSPSP